MEITIIVKDDAGNEYKRTASTFEDAEENLGKLARFFEKFYVSNDIETDDKGEMMARCFADPNCDRTAADYAG